MSEGIYGHPSLSLSSFGWSIRQLFKLLWGVLRYWLVENCITLFKFTITSLINKLKKIVEPIVLNKKIEKKRKFEINKPP